MSRFGCETRSRVNDNRERNRGNLFEQLFDVFTDDGYLRPDGRMVHSVGLTQIKTPAESKSEWDIYKLVTKLNGDDVFRPLHGGGCPDFPAK